MPAIVTLKKGEGRLLKRGGAWIFDNEIARVSGDFSNGDIVDVADHDGYPLGKGFINVNSKIRVRVLTRNPEQEINDDFWKMRVKNAWEYRKKTVDVSSCRVIFGEADFIPGFVMDKYENVLVFQALALGIDRYKEKIVEAAKEILAADGIEIKGVYERSDAKEREKEGLEKIKGFIGAEFDTNVTICENGVKYIVDVKDGQKTGFFLDQKYNRKACGKLCRGKKVLDCFTHTGSFALNAALAGAESVLAVDASASALSMAERNAKLNGFSFSEDPGDQWMRNEKGTSLRFMEADLLELLPEIAAGEERYDVVILDPPAFAKSRQNVKSAVKGYRKINAAGMRITRDGGFLMTCTCSHFMTRELFEKMLLEASREAHVRLRQIEARAQAPDHPILWSAEESSYLKFYIFQIVHER
jgi:23S rRNA (cytosine1962-C5)-methyltransferase